MKYVLKGLEVTVNGELFSKGKLDASFKVAELELEGNFEEVYKEVLPAIFSILEQPKNKEVKEEVNIHGNDCSCAHCLDEKAKTYNLEILEEAVRTVNVIGLTKVYINNSMLTVESTIDGIIFKKNNFETMMVPKDGVLADYYNDIMLLTK